jgi:energy-coupling factor transporter ATP-binding protein EcfA2
MLCACCLSCKTPRNRWRTELAAAMQIERIVLTQIKRFDQLELRLKPGLNLISGANESGKSTLALALRCAFLERVKSQPVAAMLRPSGAPGVDNANSTIRVQFRYGQYHFDLDKNFGAKKSTLLRRREGEVVTDFLDDVAEEMLVKLWYARVAERGASAAKQQGLLSLLWVNQADLTPAAWLEDAHQTLSAELAKQLPIPTVSRQLSAKIDAEIAEFVGARGVPVKAYAKRVSELAALAGQLTQVRDSADALKTDMSELAALAAPEQADAEPALQAALAALHRELADIAESRLTLAPQLAQTQLLEEKQRSAARALLERANQVQQLLAQIRRKLDHSEALQLRITTLRASLQEQAAAQAPLQQKLLVLNADISQRVLAIKAARTELEQAQKAQQQRALESIVQRFDVLSAQSESAAPELELMRQSARARRHARTLIDALKTQLTQSIAQATEIRFSHANAANPALPTLSGRAIALDTPQLLSEDSTLAFADGSQLQIRPAPARSEQLRNLRAGHLAAIADWLAQPTLTLSDSLAALQQDFQHAKGDAELLSWLTSFANVLDREDELLRERDSAQARRSVSLEELQRQLQAHSTAEISAARAALAEADEVPEPNQRAPYQHSLFDSAAAPVQDATTLSAQLAALETALAAQQLQQRKVQAQCERDQATFSTQQRELAEQEGQWHIVRDASELVSRAQRLLSADQQASTATTADSTANNSAALRPLLPALLQLEKNARAAAQDDALKQSLATLSSDVETQRSSAALLARRNQDAEQKRTQLQLRLQEKQRRQHTLQGQINARCQEDLELKLAHLTAAHGQLSEALNRDQRRLAALQYLRTHLDAIRNRLEQDLSAPLNAKLAPYLLQVFGAQAQVRFDAQFMPTHIQRQVLPNAAAISTAQQDFAALAASDFAHLPQTSVFPVSALSVGTREQLALLVRLAYADVLADAGAAVLLVFDDVLAYSDATRRQGFAEALKLAAQRHQIILLSCNPALWPGLAAAHHLHLPS